MRAVVSTFVIFLFLTLCPQVPQAQAQPSAAVVAVSADQVDMTVSGTRKNTVLYLRSL